MYVCVYAYTIYNIHIQIYIYIYTCGYPDIHTYIQFVLTTTFVSSFYYVMVFHAEYAMHITSGMGKCPIDER